MKEIKLIKRKSTIDNAVLRVSILLGYDILIDTGDGINNHECINSKVEKSK